MRLKDCHGEESQPWQSCQQLGHQNGSSDSWPLDPRTACYQLVWQIGLSSLRVDSFPLLDWYA
jgi:hypothetical protein